MDQEDSGLVTDEVEPTQKKTKKKRSKKVVLSDEEQTEQPQDSDTSPQKEKKARKPRQYIPQYRSGGWAIMIALHELELNNPDFKGFGTKNEIVTKAQLYCNASMTRVPDIMKNNT